MNMFSMDSRFSQFMTKVFNLIILNLMFLILSIPVITIGANITAMYYVLLKMAKGEDPYIWKSFWKSWKMNFKQATVLWLLLLVPAAVIVYDLSVADSLPGIMKYARILFLVVGILLIALFSYAFPVLSRFDNTIKNILRNSFIMLIRHLGWTIVILLIHIAPILIYGYASNEIAAWILLFMLICGFSTLDYGCSYVFANEVFPYYEPKEEEDSMSEEEELEHAIQALNDDGRTDSDDELTEEPVEMIGEAAAEISRKEPENP